LTILASASLPIAEKGFLIFDGKKHRAKFPFCFRWYDDIEEESVVRTAMVAWYSSHKQSFDIVGLIAMNPSAPEPEILFTKGQSLTPTLTCPHFLMSSPERKHEDF
jgi:hypothetical protein